LADIQWTRIFGWHVDSDRINRWLTFGANFGVLVGIFLLIAELRQNGELMRIQVEQERSQNYHNWLRQAAGDDNFLAVFAKIQEPGNSMRERISQLSEIDQMRLRFLVSARFYDYETLHAQYEQGYVSEDYWQERAIPGIRSMAPVWAGTHPPDGPAGRRAFKEEVRRIMNGS
jgi:hypothetical protein